MQQIKQDSETMKEGNRLLVFNLIRTTFGLSRAELAKVTKMSSTSIGRIVNALIEDELVIETGSGQNRLGRKATSLAVNPDGRYAVGIDMDVHEASIGLVNLKGSLIYSRVILFDSGAYDENRLIQIAEETSNFLDSLSQDIHDKILGIGITVPGHIRWSSGELVLSPQLGLHNMKVKTFFESRFPYPVFADNDVKAQALAERLWGIAQQEPDFVMTSIGNGFGLSIFQNGVLLRGKDNIAGELGHIIVKPGGYPCDCGKRGCLQTYLSVPCIEKRSDRTLSSLLEAARSKEEPAASQVDEILETASLWIANLINIYNPPLFILSGKLIKLWPDFSNQISIRYNEYVWPHLKNSIRIVSSDKSPLPANSRPILSASAIIFYHYFYN